MVGKKRQQAAVLAEDEEFPRGGAELLTAQERRQIEKEALAAVEGEIAAGKSPARKKTKVGKLGGGAKEDEDTFYSRESMHGKVIKYVELLKYKHLTVGMKLWGIVLEVSSKGLTVSLPHGLRGQVAPEEATDVLADEAAVAAASKSGGGAAAADLPALFYVGQYVRCAVLRLSETEAGEDGEAGGHKSRRIQLSLQLRRVCGGLTPDAVAAGAALPAVVRSVEDHGYTLGFGIKGVTGFLRKKDHQALFGAESALLRGMLLEVVVRDAGDKRRVSVTTSPSDVSSTLTREADSLSITGLLPGALVNVKIRSVLQDGLLVSFLTYFHGTVDKFHLAAPLAGGQDWRSQYAEGQTHKARIVAVNPLGSKKVSLSLAPHLLSFSLPSPTPLMGQVFQAATVVRVDPELGLLLRLPTEPLPCAGYVHVSNAAEERVDKLEKVFKPGQAVTARVIGFRLVDGLSSASLKPSVIEQQVLTYKDIAAGMPLSGTVLSVEDYGLLVGVTSGIKALVPVLHTADVAFAKFKTKFKVGQKVAGRVLEVNPAERRVSMTLKKALLTSSLPLIASAAHAAPGTKSHGMVTGTKDYGVFVSFYGGMKGLLRSAELALPPGGKPEDQYKPGQVVKVTVASFDRATQRMQLTLGAAAGANSKKQQQAAAANGGAGGDDEDVALAANGSHGTVGSHAGRGVDDMLGGLQPGDVVARGLLKERKDLGGKATFLLELEGHAGGGVVARLDAAHLSDHPAAAAALAEVLLQPGTPLGPLLVLHRVISSPHGPHVVVTRKQAMVAAAGGLPHAVDEVKETALLPGYVANVTPDAVYVRFLGHVTGRAGLAQLADQFVSDPALLFADGQSVRGQVVSVDSPKQRFTLTLKPSLTGSADGSFLLALFADLDLAAALQAQQEQQAAATTGGGGSDEDGGGGSGEDGGVVPVDWDRSFPLGRLASGQVHEVKDYGAVVDLDAHPDVVGLVTPGQGGKGLAPGHPLTGLVLDVNRKDGIVDLSLKAVLVAAGKAAAAAAATPSGGKKTPGGGGGGSKKKAAALAALESNVAASAAALLPAVGSSVKVVVELVKAHYVVVSLPEHGHAIGYVAASDFNMERGADGQPQQAAGLFKEGQALTATVARLPGGGAGEQRLLLHVALHSLKASASLAVQRRGEAKENGARVAAGSIVKAIVSHVYPTYLEVQIEGSHTIARVFVTEAASAADPLQPSDWQLGSSAAGGKGGKGSSNSSSSSSSSSFPFASYKPGQAVEAVVLGRLQGVEGHRHGVTELSLRPAALEAARAKAPLPAALKLSDLSAGQVLGAYVQEVASDHVWCVAGPTVRGRLHLLDVSSDPSQLAQAAALLKPGQALRVKVLQASAGQHLLDLALLEADGMVVMRKPAVAPCGTPPAVGQLLMGRVTAAGAAGVWVSLGGKTSGRVALSDIHDAPVSNALEGLTEGTYVRCYVLDAPPGGKPALSLRPSRGGSIPGRAAPEKAAAASAGKGKAAKPPADGAAQQLLPELLPPGGLQEGAAVQGYVKQVDKRGAFVCLDRSTDGRIKLCNLSDGFLEDPAAAFPPGQHVQGVVVDVAGGRVELSLRKAAAATGGKGWLKLADLKEGQAVRGSVRRVEAFGVFVELANSALVGLAHISELADAKVTNVHALFKPKQPVRARVLKIDREAGKISLGLKPSYFAGGDDGDGDGDQDDEGGSGAGDQRRKQRREVDIDEEMADALDDLDEDGGSDDDDDDDDDDSGAALDSSDDLEAALRGAGGGDSDDDEDDDDEEEEEEEEEEDEGGSGDEDEEMEDVDVDAMSDDDDDDEAGSSGSGSEDDDEEGGDCDVGDRRGRGARAAAADLDDDDSDDVDARPSWAGLQLDSGAGPAGGARGCGGDENGDGSAPGGGKGSKKKAQKAKEEAIRRAELARLSGDGAPRSAADYEQLVMASPNSSFVWIKYMAFLISSGDVDKARALGERGLAAIHYREDGEKFNVWVALLNLENAYGQPTAEEAVMKIFQRALPYCNQKRLYLALLGILERSGRTALVAQVTKTLCKKFGGSAKVWLHALEYTLTREAAAAADGGGDAAAAAAPSAASVGEAAQKTLERALQVLPRRKHLKVISQAALLEFRVGSAERGRGILEGVLRNYPKRLDLWSLYLDQEIKLGDRQRTRALFERATHLSLPPKKMKLLFKRYLQFEKAGGDAAGVDHVKRRAMEFVESTMK